MFALEPPSPQLFLPWVFVDPGSPTPSYPSVPATFYNVYFGGKAFTAPSYDILVLILTVWRRVRRIRGLQTDIVEQPFAMRGCRHRALIMLCPGSCKERCWSLCGWISASFRNSSPYVGPLPPQQYCRSGSSVPGFAVSVQWYTSVMYVYYNYYAHPLMYPPRSTFSKDTIVEIEVKRLMSSTPR